MSRHTREVSHDHHDRYLYCPGDCGPVFSEQERLALAGFLAGYSGVTRKACALDLRQFAAWCHHHGLRLFGVPWPRSAVTGSRMEAR